MQTYKFLSRPFINFSIQPATLCRLASSRYALRLVFATIVAMSIVPAVAQTAHLVNGVTIVPGGLSGYVAVDAAGQVYSTDATGSVLRQNIRDSIYSETTVATGFSDPRGVAVDSAGNVYVADFGGNRIAKVPFNGTTYGTPVSIGTGIVNPRGIAVDSSGNVYASDSANQVVKETLSGGTYTQSTIGSGFSATYAVAVDAAANVYVTDPGANKVYKETPSGGSYTQSTVGSGLSNCFAVAVDASGNVYLADYDNNRILLETLSGGTYTQSVLLGGIAADSVAVDAYGNVFATNPTGNALEAIQAGGVDFFQVNIGTASQTGVLNFGFDTGGTIGSTAVLTNGSSGLDFKDLGTGTCATNGTSHTYSAGDTCTINVTLTPKYSGVRRGAARLTTAGSSAAPFATAFVYGSGVGPQITFTPGTITNLFNTGLVEYALAVDATGSVYVTNDSQILKETFSGGLYTQSVVVDGLFNVLSVAVDAAGTIYLDDFNHQQVLTETPIAGGYKAGSVPFSPAGTPAYVAVDGSGNVYIGVDPGGGISYPILKETLVGGTYTQSTVTTTPELVPFFVDSIGNVYVVDPTHDQVVKETLSGGTYTESVVAPGTTDSIAVDATGNVYIADQHRGLLKESLAGGVYTESVVAAIPGDIPYLFGVFVDSRGNPYISDQFGNVDLIDVADPSSLTFADTAVGATSSDSPKTVTVSNIGTSVLSFPPSSITANPTISSGFTLGTGNGTCAVVAKNASAASTLEPGTSCALAVSFTPVAPGVDSGTLVLTDDTLNIVPNPSQTIVLNGNGTGTGTPQAVLSPTSLAFGVVTTGTTSAAQTITLSNPGTATLNISSASLGGANSALFAKTTTCGTTLAAGANCTFTIKFSPTAAGSFSATLSVADNVTGSPQSAALTGTGAAPSTPQAVLSPTSLAFGSLTVGTTSAAKVVTLSNPGTAALSIAGISLTGTNAGFFVQTNTCGTSLAAGASCSISVKFSPATAGSFAASLSVKDNAASSTQTASLTGTGTAAPVPQAVLSPTSLAFGSVATGTTAAAQTVKLSNPGTGPLTISGISLTGTDSGQFAETNNCGSSLAAGASCTISVTFAPSGDAEYSASVSVADNAAGSPQSAKLGGTGFTPVVTPDFAITSPTGPQTVASGASATYAITLTPVSGSFTNAIALSVTGLPEGATASFSPASVTPGAGAATSTLTVATGSSLAFMRHSGAVLALGMLLLPWMRAKRLRAVHARLLVFVLALGGAACVSGCGSGGFAGHTSKTYVLTVTGTSGETQHATTVTLIVE